ncbi:MAG: flavin reductase family protein [bacterium]|nr:flavin reductase family protein [bacterium]
MKEVNPEFAYKLINHGPCTLITTKYGSKINLAPINWTMPVNNDPPLIASAVEENICTFDLIKKSKVWCINLVEAKYVDKILLAGKNSGYKVDKFKLTGFTPQSCSKIDCVYILEAGARIEVEYVNEVDCDGVVLFIGKVVYATADEKIFDKNLNIDLFPTPHHIGGGIFAVTKKL